MAEPLRLLIAVTAVNSGLSSSYENSQENKHIFLSIMEHHPAYLLKSLRVVKSKEMSLLRLCIELVA